MCILSAGWALTQPAKYRTTLASGQGQNNNDWIILAQNQLAIRERLHQKLSENR